MKAILGKQLAPIDTGMSFTYVCLLLCVVERTVDIMNGHLNKIDTDRLVALYYKMACIINAPCGDAHSHLCIIP